MCTCFLRKNRQIVDDGVMGGLSEGEGTLYENSLQFEGFVSLENNGGFSSLRSPYKAVDLSSFTMVEIRYKSTDYNVGFTLNKHRVWYLPNYKTNLKPTNGRWAIATIQLTDIAEYQVGRPTGKLVVQPEIIWIKKVWRKRFVWVLLRMKNGRVRLILK